MISLVTKRLTRIPIQLRLTLWYVIVMLSAFVLLSLYLSHQFQTSLLKSIDAGLQIAAAQTFEAIEIENHSLVYSDSINLSGIQLSSAGFAMRILSDTGVVVAQRGDPGEQPAWGLVQPGASTSSRMGDDTQWRTITKPIEDQDGTMIGWLQIVQSLEILTNTQQDIRDQLLLIIPLLILLAGLWGYFLANRALRPIDRVTRVAEVISGSDLTRRIAYEGPADEVGRLAATFDAMLGRLQSTFERERRFSADAAHELRTPLSVLKGKLDVTLSLERSPGEYRATLQDLNSHVERLIMLSNDLLTLSRLEQRKMEGEQTDVNLTDVIESILEHYQHLASSRRISISAQLPPTMAVKGYIDALMRLFINLMDNAVKYTPEGGRIELRAAVESESVWVELFNSTLDLTEDQVKHLFERFYRVELSRSRHSGGAGLGLSIAKEIVDAHGGQISVEKVQGLGIMFRVKMPSLLAQ